MSIGQEAARPSPERMSPVDMAGRLVESEHRGRYWWSAPLAVGRDVLDAGCGTGYGTDILAAAGGRHVIGVDISETAIQEARSTDGREAIEFVLGSLHTLPFPDASFDLAVCFETIEHIERRDLALTELRRVLRPRGVLAISSPNSKVYPSGNPHHLHEYGPGELSEALATVFTFVRVYQQSPWLAAAVFDEDDSRAVGVAGELTTRVLKIVGLEPGCEMFTVALASDVAITSPQALVALGDPFELRWWHEQVAHAVRCQAESVVALREAEERAARRQAEAVTALRESGRALLAVETELALAHNHIATLESSLAGLQDVHALRLGVGDLERRVRRAEQTVSDMDGSLSWAVTRPARAAKQYLRRH